ncbi:MAG: hypothetical protein WAV47_14760 [Blastocatellia bacterium]
MVDFEQDSITVEVKACASCASGLLERDKFCRWCGARQPFLFHGNTRDLQTIADSPSQYATSVLSISERSEVYRRVSAPLVSAVVTGALASSSNQIQSRVVKRMILALISIPIWLIIVLLSPLDAYAAVKGLAR